MTAYGVEAVPAALQEDDPPPRPERLAQVVAGLRAVVASDTGVCQHHTSKV